MKTKQCFKCGKLSEWSMYFQRYICNSCKYREKEQEPCEYCDGREKKIDGFFLRHNSMFKFWELIYRQETEQGNINDNSIETRSCFNCERKLEGEGE